MPRLVLRPGDDEAVRDILTEMSSGARRRKTLRSLSEDCRDFLLEVERGYDWCIEEYSNDYDPRDLLLDVADAAPKDLRKRLRQWVSEWDARFDAATIPVPDSGMRMSGRTGGDFRIPRRLMPTLHRDLRAWGLVE